MNESATTAFIKTLLYSFCNVYSRRRRHVYANVLKLNYMTLI